LPGVKELFQSKKKEEEEENKALAYYQKFMNQGPSYFGDLDEQDAHAQSLLDYEKGSEAEGKAHLDHLSSAYLVQIGRMHTLNYVKRLVCLKTTLRLLYLNQK
jgi:hypothetical protein